MKKLEQIVEAYGFVWVSWDDENETSEKLVQNLLIREEAVTMTKYGKMKSLKHDVLDYSGKVTIGNQEKFFHLFDFPENTKKIPEEALNYVKISYRPGVKDESYAFTCNSILRIYECYEGEKIKNDDFFNDAGNKNKLIATFDRNGAEKRLIGNIIEKSAWLEKKVNTHPVFAEMQKEINDYFEEIFEKAGYKEK